MRVEALDLVRGLCALGVAIYHYRYWTGHAELHNLGLYGVYMFFALSGASLALAYAARFRSGYPLSHYFALRYVRLAPLYIAAATFVMLQTGVTKVMLEKLALNATFLFGLANPGETSIVVGGWSLGIEFCFYLVFPALLAISKTRASWLVAVVTVALQIMFVNYVLAGGDLAASWVRYTQPAAFIGYFCVGTFVGVRFVDLGSQPWRRALPLALVAAVLMAGLATFHGRTAAASLVGLRGVACMAACLAVVAIAIRLPMPRWLSPIARLLGDASYALYLLHPIVFDVLRGRSTYLQRSPDALFAVSLVASFALATLVYRLFERPVMGWAKARLRGPSSTAAG